MESFFAVVDPRYLVCAGFFALLSFKYSNMAVIR
jgi:hypothetical protein